MGTSLPGPGPGGDRQRIALARPSLGAAELAAVERVLASGRLTQGPEVAGFETELAAALGRRHAVALASGTAALHLAVWALDLGPGDEVIVPSFTFPASANAVEITGARAVLCDIDPDSWNLSVAAVEAVLTPRTRALMPVDIFGLPAEVAPLRALAQRHRLAIIQDSACSLGGLDEGGRPPGEHAELSCHSFHPRKIITTGEGGAVLTDDDELARRCRMLRSHGMEAGRFERVGINYRLSEVNAAIGRVQLGRLPELLADRRRAVARYRERLAAEGLLEAGLSLQQVRAGQQHPYQTLAARLPAPAGGPQRAADQSETTTRRDAVLRFMADQAIELAIATHALHRIPAYAGRARATELPASDAMYARGISLPLWFGMPEAAIDTVAHTLARALAALA